jgi:hypothetical protein
LSRQQAIEAIVSKKRAGAQAELSTPRQSCRYAELRVTIKIAALCRNREGYGPLQHAGDVRLFPS